MSGYCFNIEITAYMIHNLHLQGKDLMVFALLDYYTKKNGYCHHQVDAMAAMILIHPCSIYTALKSLELNGYIEKKKVMDDNGNAVFHYKTIV